MQNEKCKMQNEGSVAAHTGAPREAVRCRETTSSAPVCALGHLPLKGKAFQTGLTTVNCTTQKAA
jgi:hypothetical protein